MNLQKKFNKSLAEKWCMRFQTSHPEEDNYDGVITHIRPEFIILREETDFEFDGIIVIPKRFIKGVRDGKNDKCCNEIIRYNDAIKNIETPHWLDSCETIPQLVETLHQQNIWFGVETIFNKGKESAFYIGPVIKVKENHFKIKCYDAAGKWEKAYKIDYDEVFKIEFDSRYCNHFNAFMQSKDKDVTKVSLAERRKT